MIPWRVVRVALLEALVMPALRRIISASGRLPLASVKAFLHSIIPAPVRSRSSFTNFALISMASCRSLILRLADRQGADYWLSARCLPLDYSTVCGVVLAASLASDPGPLRGRDME